MPGAILPGGIAESRSRSCHTAAMAGSRTAAISALVLGVLGVLVLALTLPHTGPSAADLLDPDIRAGLAVLAPVLGALNTLGQLPFWGALVLIEAAIVFR